MLRELQEAETSVSMTPKSSVGLRDHHDHSWVQRGPSASLGQVPSSSGPPPLEEHLDPCARSRPCKALRQWETGRWKFAKESVLIESWDCESRSPGHLNLSPWWEMGWFLPCAWAAPLNRSLCSWRDTVWEDEWEHDSQLSLFANCLPAAGIAPATSRFSAGKEAEFQG